MRYKTENEFSKAIKGGAQGLIFLCGNEDFLIQNWRRTVLAQFGSEESFNLQKLDGNNLDLDALYDATQMLPLFAASKCVYLADLDPSKLLAGDNKKLEQVFEDLPADCVLLITSRAPAFDSKKAHSKKLMAMAEKHGAVLELDGRNKSSMVRFIAAQAKAGGASISPELCRYILEVCENDMQSLTGEVAKIAAYAVGEEISKAHIDAVASPRTEAKVFDLSRAITDGNAQRAMEILRNLFSMRENPVAIVATLIMSYTDLYRTRIAKDEGKTVQDILAAFSYGGRDFRVRNAFRISMSTAAARLSLNLLHECEQELKGSSLNPEFVVEKTVLALLACREG